MEFMLTTSTKHEAKNQIKLNLLETRSFSSLKSSLLEKNNFQVFDKYIKKTLAMMNHYNTKAFELFGRTTNKKLGS